MYILSSGQSGNNKLMGRLWIRSVLGSLSYGPQVSYLICMERASLG